WGTSWSSQAFCTLCRTPPLARPSMVVTCLPTAALKGTTQERTAAPLRCTVKRAMAVPPPGDGTGTIHLRALKGKRCRAGQQNRDRDGRLREGHLTTIRCFAQLEH